MLRPAHYRLHEIAVIEIDLEWRVGEVDRGEVESRLRQVDAVIVANFGAGQCCLHHAGVATCNVEKAEGRLEHLVCLVFNFAQRISQSERVSPIKVSVSPEYRSCPPSDKEWSLSEGRGILPIRPMC